MSKRMRNVKVQIYLHLLGRYMLLKERLSQLECRQERGRRKVKQLIKFEMLWLSGKWKQVALRFINFFPCF